MGKFVYKKRTAADVEKRARQYSGNFDSFISSEYPSLKVKEGEVTLRIMRRTWPDKDCDPPKNYGDGFDLPIQVHFGVGPDNATYLCNEKMRGQSCPVCDARLEAEDEEEGRKMAPSKRSLCWVIDRNNEKAGPQVWSVPASLMREIINRTNSKRGVIEVDDWDEGFDVTFVREGNDQRTKYTQVEFSRDATPLNDNPKIQDKWIAYVEDHPLPDVLNFYDEEYIEKILKGKKAKASRDDDDEDDQPRRKTAAKSKRSSRDEDEQEDEDERRASRTKSRREADEGEDEDDRRSSRTKSKREEEEDDEEIPFEEPKSKKNGKRADEDEEDDPPQKTRATTRASKPSRDAEEDEDGEGDGEDETPSEQARRGLDRLKGKGAERR